MTTANWFVVVFSFLWPCCALSFWSRDTWLFVRTEMELGRVTTGVLLLMSAIGSVLTWWLPRLPPMPRTPTRSCERCESLVSLVPLGPEPAPPPCDHPAPYLYDPLCAPHEEEWLCDGCEERVTLMRPRTQEEADQLLEAPRWEVVPQPGLTPPRPEQSPTASPGATLAP